MTPRGNQTGAFLGYRFDRRLILDPRRQGRKSRLASAPPTGRLLASGDAVGEKLRAMFQAVEAAPVPMDMHRLVLELENRRRGRGPKAN